MAILSWNTVSPTAYRLYTKAVLLSCLFSSSVPNRSNHHIATITCRFMRSRNPKTSKAIQNNDFSSHYYNLKLHSSLFCYDIKNLSFNLLV